MKIDLTGVPPNIEKISELKKAAGFYGRFYDRLFYFNKLFTYIWWLLTAVFIGYYLSKPDINLGFVILKIIIVYLSFVLSWAVLRVLIKQKFNLSYESISLEKVKKVEEWKLIYPIIENYVSKVNIQNRDLINLEFEAFEKKIDVQINA